MHSSFLKVLSFALPLTASLGLAGPSAAQVDDLLLTTDPAIPTPGDEVKFLVDQGTPGDFVGILIATDAGPTNFPIIGLMQLGLENFDLWNAGQFDADGHAFFECGHGTCAALGISFYVQAFSLRIPPIELAGKSNPLTLMVDASIIEDCNGNGIDDDCETFPDCNANGVPDECDPDCDDDGVPDDCESDCNANGIPDDCEVCSESFDVIWNFDACLAFSHGDEFSEFTGVANGGCANVSARASYIDQPKGGHSCTADAITGAPGDAACVMADDDSYFDFNDVDNTLYWSVTVTESNGEVAALKDFSFWHQAPDWFTQSDENGFFVTYQNDPPALYGLRILRDGVVVFFEDDIATSSTWKETVFDFADDPSFLVTSDSVKFDFELLAYAPVDMGGDHGSIWDIDQFEVTVCCAGGSAGDCDRDGTPDFCELDCNENGVPDDCDILNGTSWDDNHNGIPDECECTPPAWPTEAGSWDLEGEIYVKSFSSSKRDYKIDCMTATYDGGSNLRIVGTASNSSGTVSLDFTYTVSHDGSDLKSYDGSNDFGTIEFLPTGQTIQLRGREKNGYAGRLKSTGSGQAELKGWFEDLSGNKVGDFENDAEATCFVCN